MSGTSALPPGPPEDDGGSDPDIRAGELVLGVLSPDEAVAVRRQAMVDLAMADAIVRWEVRLSPLISVAGDIAPPTGLWSRIEETLAPRATTPSDIRATVAPIGADAPNVVPFAPPQRSAGWKWATAASLALAAGFAAVAFIPRTAPLRQIAALAPLNGPSPAFIAQTDGGRTVVLTAVSPASVPSDRDMELWLLPPGATTPTSLGVLPSTGKVVTLPATQPVGTKLLISLEPRGGSKTGQPTGPVIYGGSLGNT